MTPEYISWWREYIWKEHKKQLVRRQTSRIWMRSLRIPSFPEIGALQSDPPDLFLLDFLFPIQCISYFISSHEVVSE